MRIVGVVETEDQGMFLERGLHDGSLNTLSAAVNEADLGQSCVVGGVHIFGDDGRNISWMERMEIERRLDWDSVGHEFSLCSHPASCLLSPVS